MRTRELLRRAAALLLLLAALLPAVWRPAAEAQTRPAGGEPRRAEDGQALLEPSDGAAAAGFGGAVALSGDTLAVGAQYTDVNGIMGAGAVYLFQRDAQAANGWTESQIISRDPPVDLGFFGTTIALHGDTLVVGAPTHTGNAGYAQGEARVYERDPAGGQWQFVTTLADETQAPLRYFGSSVAVGDDLIAVGAQGAEGNRGRVYLFSRTAGWARVKTLSDAAGLPYDSFGFDVALQGDTLVVGAVSADFDTAQPDTGAAFVFERDQGGAGQWGLARRLVADTPTSESQFGATVALDGDRIVAGAPREDSYAGGQPTANSVGAAYVFGRDAGGPGQWGQLAALRAADGQGGDYFGSAVAIAGDQVWAGAPNADGGFDSEGRVYVFAPDAAGNWVAGPPIEADDRGLRDKFGGALAVAGDELLVGAADRTPVGAAYVIDVAATPAPDQSLYVPVAASLWFATTGTLADGDSLESPSGAIIGAVAGTLAAPLDATIMLTAPPPVPLPPAFFPRGDYYLLGARTLTHMPAEKPLLVGLPVPAGVDTAHLAAAAYVPDRLSTETGDEEATTSSWSAVPGRYDPATNLFVITVSALLPEGITLVLFEHPENDPLPDPANRQAGQAVEYVVGCDPAAANQDVCEEGYYRLVADEMEAAHQEFVNIRGFEPPRLVHLAGSFVGGDKAPNLDTIAYHGVQVATAPCTGAEGQPIAGEYRYKSLQILICIDPLGSSRQLQDTVRHELFHAIQASYPIVADDRYRTGGTRVADWLVEGTAAAAERSGDLMARTAWELRWATHPLLSIGEEREYQAQDFWVYTGREELAGDNSLDYLHAVFQAGATPAHANGAFNVAETYWSWAKNQVFEHHELFDGAFGVGPCEFDPQTYNGQSVLILNYPATYFVEGYLPPLTTGIVMIRSSLARDIMPVGASTAGDPLNLRYKVYQIGEDNCETMPDGARILFDIPEGGERYVVVSNVSFTEEMEYVVEVD